MKLCYRTFYLSCLLLGLTLSMQLRAEWVITDNTVRTPATATCCELYLTDNAELSASDVAALPTSDWQSLTGPNINSGFDPRIHWIKLRVTSRLSEEREWVLQLDNPLLDKVELYQQADNGVFVHLAELGVSNHSRLVLHPDYLVPLSLPMQGQTMLLIRFQTQGSASLPITLWRGDHFVETNHVDSLLIGLALGALLLMGVYNSLLAFSMRTLSYLFYAGYQFSGILMLSTLLGISSYYLWPALPTFHHLMIPVLGALALLFTCFFVEHLLKINEQYLLLMRWLRAMQIGCILYLFSSFIMSYRLAVILLAILVVLVVASLISIGFWACWKRIPMARYYTFSWFALTCGATLSSLAYAGVIALPWSNAIPLLLGAGLEVLVMTTTLALRAGDVNRSHRAAEKSAIEQARRVRLVQDKALQIQAKANTELEQKVRERTFELEVALRELAETNRELEEQTTRDALTGVRNRKYFDKRYIAEQRRSRREQTTLSLIMMDIDHFKQVNDTYGHPVGDACIREVASRAASLLKRPGDVIARYGGEEFALILPNTPPEGAMQLAEKLCDVIRSQPIVTGVGELALTISCGVACRYILPETSTELLLEEADQALYGAKQGGRDRAMLASQKEKTD
ncbi:diguanylate cyclase [Corallincola platygyrae]|uniref:diguanylate cyclase n=1 Tax=Corallincola platygyrae TaxID=1193278 RepID=A0ABW4XKP0_9GAMM